MNQDQFLSWLRTTLGGIGALAVQYGLTNDSTVTAITGAVVAIAPFVWGFFVHTDTAKVEAAGAVVGIKPIEVMPSASSALQKLAMDPTVPSIVVAPPSYAPPRSQKP